MKSVFQMWLASVVLLYPFYLIYIVILFHFIHSISSPRKESTSSRWFLNGSSNGFYQKVGVLFPLLERTFLNIGWWDKLYCLPTEIVSGHPKEKLLCWLRVFPSALKTEELLQKFYHWNLTQYLISTIYLLPDGLYGHQVWRGEHWCSKVRPPLPSVKSTRQEEM